MSSAPKAAATPGPTLLRRNSRWAPGKKFEGEWTVIPTEDFEHTERVVTELLAACEALLDSKYIQEQIAYLDKGVGTSTGLGKAILAARAAIARITGSAK